MSLEDSVSSIVRKYNQAADWEKPSVVKVLSQLEGVTQTKIRSILKQNGCDMTYAVKAAKRPSKKAARKPAAKETSQPAKANAAGYTKKQMLDRIGEIPLSQILADAGISLVDAGQFRIPDRNDLTCLRIFPDDRGWKDVRSDYQPTRRARPRSDRGSAPTSPDWDPSPAKLGGNAIALVQRLDGVDAQQAVQKLLDRYEPKMGRALRAAHPPEQGTYTLDAIYKAAREIPVTRICEDNGIPLKPEGQTFKPAIKNMNKGLKVYPGAGGWHDFKEDVGGGPLEFMEHFLHMDRRDALKSLVTTYLPHMLPDLERITNAAERKSTGLLAGDEAIHVTYRGSMNAEQRQSFSETIKQIHEDQKTQAKSDPRHAQALADRGYAR